MLPDANIHFQFTRDLRMNSKPNRTTSSLPPRWMASGWMIFAGCSAISFALYAISLLFMTPEALPLLATAAIAGIGLMPCLFNLFFCPWMNIGFGVIMSTPILGALTYAYPNWFTIGVTVFMASLAAIMWGLSSVGAAAALKLRYVDWR